MGKHRKKVRSNKAPISINTVFPANIIEKKHGQNKVTMIRSFEKLKPKYMKTGAGVKFIKFCKTSNDISTFANVNLSSHYGSYKLKKHIARIITENKLQCKHQEKKKLKQEIVQLDKKLTLCLNMVIYHNLLHQTNIAVKTRLKVKVKYTLKNDKVLQQTR